MAKVTIVVANILIAIGVIGYVMSGMASVTALIPAFVGAALELCGLLALKESRRKHAMHAAVLVALIGFLGAAPGLPKLGALLAGEAERPMAVAAQAAMATLLAVYIVLCVRSFVAARRSAGSGDSTP